MKKKIVFVLIAFVIGFSIFQYYSNRNQLQSLSLNAPLTQKFVNNNRLKQKAFKYLIENSKDKYTKAPFSIKFNDFEELDKDYIFNTIESALKVASKKLNSKLYTEDQFLNYVLPYRLNFEKVEDWRALALSKYNFSDETDIFQQVKKINDSLKTTFEYTGNHFPNKPLSYLYKKQEGGCFEMSNIAAYTMRANGIPVAIDFAKWSNITGRHQWNSLILKDKSIPFMGIESEPKPEIELDLVLSDFKRFAKVYRKSFKKYENFNSDFNPKKIISNVNYIDVTTEYCKQTKDIKLNFGNELTQNDLVYLCVYEDNYWVPVDFSYYNNQELLFKNVCVNNVFTLRKKVDKKLEYFKSPFTFNTQGTVVFRKPDSLAVNNVKLTHFNSAERELIKLLNSNLEFSEIEKIRDDVLLNNITGVIQKDTVYSLFVWDKKWKKINESKGQNGYVIFNNVPNNALFKLEKTNDSSSTKNRCFTINSDFKQNWWSAKID